MHVWTEQPSLPSGAKVWHCPYCHRSVQSEEPPGDSIPCERRQLTPPRRKCAHYDEAGNRGREVGRIVLTTLHPDRTGAERVEVFVCDRCCEEMRHWIAYRCP